MKDKKGFIFLLTALTIFINFWFPKGGIKIGGIPITIGEVLFGLLVIFWIMFKVINKKIKFSIVLLIAEVYFLIRMIIAYNQNVNIVEFTGYAIPLIVFPFIFFVIINEINTQKKYEIIMKILVIGFFFLCIYSFIQYTFGIADTSIPGITVNYSDYKENGKTWYLHKSNGTSNENCKIVSTYQNGNLLGVNLIIFFPIIYEYLVNSEKSKLALTSLIFFILTVFLTLSRSCWVGIILFILFRVVLDKNKNKQELVKKLFLFVFAIIAIIIIFTKIPLVSNRILNMDINDVLRASGRTNGAIMFFKSILNNGNIIINLIIGAYGFTLTEGLAYEATPVAVFKISGLIGLLLWLIPFILFIKKMNKKDDIEKSYRLDLIIWLIVACIEGAYWLPPTACNVFTMIGLGYAYKYNLKNGEN